MVIFIHRYDYQGLNEDPNDVGKTQIIIAKHRNGAIADVDRRFRADEVRFVDEDDSLVHHAAVIDASADGPAQPAVPPSYIPISDLGGGNDFAANDEFA